MAIDLYGSNNPVAGAKGAVGRAAGAASQQTAGKMFSKGAAKGAFQKALGHRQASLDQAIEAWGEDTARNWKENGAKLMQAVHDDLSQMRIKAQQAKAQGDMETYKLAMQRILFDKQMAEYGKALDDAILGSKVSGIVGGLGQITAGLLSRKKPAKETGTNPLGEYLGQGYLMGD